jgi:hypothetical protein
MYTYIQLNYEIIKKFINTYIFLNNITKITIYNIIMNK